MLRVQLKRFTSYTNEKLSTAISNPKIYSLIAMAMLSSLILGKNFRDLEKDVSNFLIDFKQLRLSSVNFHTKCSFFEHHSVIEKLVNELKFEAS